MNLRVYGIDSSSPCKTACELDADRSFCLGCGRTVSDIRNWSKMSDDTKIKSKFEAQKKLLDIL
jgi:predicted Fe-S protein YdhL (DUF1289 family)|tara:strand:- start:545 stop:736 length:192 start_codon:yes stop_codon:yes gene_type:complete